MPKGIYYDGDYFVATAVEGVQESNPFPTQPFTKILTQKFQQLRVNPDTGAPVFKALNIGSVPLQSGMNPPEPFVGGGGVGKKGRAVPFGGGAGTGPWLVSESPRLDIGAGVVEWTRTWAHVPAMIYSFPSLNYNRQVYSVSSIPWGGNWDAYGNFHGVYRTFTAIEVVQNAATNPAIAATDERSRHSVSNCCASLARLAPSAERMDSSAARSASLRSTPASPRRRKA